jgi:integrase/recombinase XerC
MIGLTLDDLDLDLDVLVVLGKGRRERSLPFGHKAGEALDRVSARPGCAHPRSPGRSCPASWPATRASVSGYAT